jgi:hypothetical protein
MKYVYNLELVCEKFGFSDECPSWNHCADNLDILAHFVYNIVHEVTGDFAQLKIKVLKVTRFKNGTDSKKKVNGGYGKGFFGWDWCCEFNSEDISNINSWIINSKTEKKFIKTILKHWNGVFSDLDKRNDEIEKELKKNGVLNFFKESL